MAKIINIGKSKIEVRLNHAKKSVVYFAENILGCSLVPWQKNY